jgi:uncharacterized Tic20 family protein
MGDLILEKPARTWGMLCHLSALSIFIGIPLGNIIVPLIIWLIKKDDHPFIDQQGKESLNFQISMLIYSVISAILVFVAVGIFLLIALALFDVIAVIIATIRASDGEYFRYPLTIRFIK